MLVEKISQSIIDELLGHVRQRRLTTLSRLPDLKIGITLKIFKHKEYIHPSKHLLKSSLIYALKFLQNLSYNKYGKSFVEEIFFCKLIMIYETSALVLVYANK